MNALNTALQKDALSRPLKRPNALHPDHMTAHERRTELCGLLTKAVVRIVDRDRDRPSKNIGDSSLRFPRKQSGTAGPVQRRSA